MILRKQPLSHFVNSCLFYSPSAIRKINGNAIINLRSYFENIRKLRPITFTLKIIMYAMVLRRICSCFQMNVIYRLAKKILTTSRLLRSCSRSFCLSLSVLSDPELCELGDILPSPGDALNSSILEVDNGCCCSATAFLK